LMMVGMLLIAESLGAHMPKGYLYSAMGFSLLVELLNLRGRSKREKLNNN
jgi:predicted tellurium resistance membrane protein TerC